MRFSTRLHLNDRSSRTRSTVSRYAPAVWPQAFRRGASAGATTAAAAATAAAGKAARPTTAAARAVARGRTRLPLDTTTAAIVAAAASASAPAAAAAAGMVSAVPGVVCPDFAIDASSSAVLSGPGGLLEAHLDYVDPKTNADKFYVLQVVQITRGGARESHVCAKWGRRGAAGQVKIDGPFTTAAATALFEKKFKAKTGLSFANRDGNDGLAGKYKMARRLREAGAGVGEIAFSLMWDNVHTADGPRNDLDLHVTCPSGEIIKYSHKQSACGGVLDVDRQQGAPEPIENVVWGSAPPGKYVVHVDNYSSSHDDETPCKVGIMHKGVREIIDLVMPRRSTGVRKVLVKALTL